MVKQVGGFRYVFVTKEMHEWTGVVSWGDAAIDDCFNEEKVPVYRARAI